MLVVVAVIVDASSEFTSEIELGVVEAEEPTLTTPYVSDDLCKLTSTSPVTLIVLVEVDSVLPETVASLNVMLPPPRSSVVAVRLA